MKVSNRFRFEERLIQNDKNLAFKIRNLVRASYPLDKQKKWNLVLYDEIHLNLNNTKIINNGFDQNRLFLGISRQLTKQISLECGYMMNYINNNNQADRINHIPLAQLMIKF